jgi:hypothetical protein
LDRKRIRPGIYLSPTNKGLTLKGQTLVQIWAVLLAGCFGRALPVDGFLDVIDGFLATGLGYMIVHLENGLWQVRKAQKTELGGNSLDRINAKRLERQARGMQIDRHPE